MLDLAHQTLGATMVALHRSTVNPWCAHVISCEVLDPPSPPA